MGKDKDTPEFAVQSMRTWWYDVDQWTFPQACRLYITDDGGGSNSRSRLWKQGLARLAEEIGFAIQGWRDKLNSLVFSQIIIVLLSYS